MAGATRVSSAWRLLWISVGLGPLIGLGLIFAVGFVLDLFRGTWGGSALLVLGLPFVHVIGVIPAAISAGLNILVARVAGSRALRLLAAPFCGAVASLVYVPFSTSMHERHWFMVFVMVLCAVSSLACVAIEGRRRVAQV